MTITKFRAFLATVECGSFTEAAKRLYYTQSAVSRMVSDLESQWGVALLNRKKNRIDFNTGRRCTFALH